MTKTYFKYNGTIFTLFYENNRLIIYKYENNRLILLNDKEKEMLKKLLNNKYNYVYDSELLDSLIDQNNSIENKEYIYNFLSWLENIIPLECRDNFYRNISTLNTTLNLDFNVEKDIEEGYTTAGGYNTKNNSIVMSVDSLAMLRNIADKTNTPDEFYWKGYSQTLLHELAHMASSNYNQNTSISMCGFDVYPSLELENHNRGLTEGFTEIISMAGIPGTIEISSGYYIDASIINQIIHIIGNEIFIKSYFSNSGISPIKSKLNELINNPEKAFELFRNIEINYQIRNLDEEQNVLANIQSSILDYLEEKIKKLSDLGRTEDINILLDSYEKYLITPEKLSIMKKNPDNYIDLQNTLDKFSKIRNMYLIDFSENDIENKHR